MSIPKKLISFRFRIVLVTRLRRAFASNLDLTDAHKVQAYEQLCASVSLQDISYWLEVILSAGIATLGLVLNSPAVIIGAMLISPLMGSILSNGLGLATGDIVLWLRSSTNLLLSCLVAIAFAMVLVFFLPFKEMTAEISARTQPTLLDLIVALFSGAVGSVATCNKVKGVAASLPGVAIAVALMPPLCVVGYGLGTYLSLDSRQGLVVARGGGLLFMTNLVAIIFTAMVVFFLVQFDTKRVREQIQIWRTCDAESRIVMGWLERFPRFFKFRRIGGLTSRFVLILAALGIISYPLTRSLQQVRQQIAQQQEKNQLQSTIKETWEETMGGETNNSKSYIDRLDFSDEGEYLKIQIQLVTDKLFTAGEQAIFTKNLAAQLDRQPDDISLNLIQIPTGHMVNTQPSPLATPLFTSLGELKTKFLQEVGTSLQQFTLPKPLKFVTYQVVLRDKKSPLELDVVYLGDRPLQSDAQEILAGQLRDTLQTSNAQVRFDYLPSQLGVLPLPQEATTLSADAREKFDEIGKQLQTYPNLILKLATERQAEVNPGDMIDFTDAIRDYLTSQWQITGTQIQEESGSSNSNNSQITFSFIIDPNYSLTGTTSPAPGERSPISPPAPKKSPKVSPQDRGIF